MELVVVIAILGILAGLAIPRFMDATASARGARIVADMRTIDSAIMMYNAKTGNLPTSKDALTIDKTTGGVTSAIKVLAAWPTPPTGTAKVTNGDKDILLTENQSTYIPVGVVHALENPGKVPLELIEVQSGSYLGEDDIVRFEDLYGRV